MTLLMRDKENIEKGNYGGKSTYGKVFASDGHYPRKKALLFAAKMSLEELQQIKKSLKKDN